MEAVPDSAGSDPAFIAEFIARPSSSPGSPREPIAQANPNVDPRDQNSVPLLPALLPETIGSPDSDPTPFPLFDANRPYYPNTLLLHHFVSVFLAHAGAVFAFFDGEQLMEAAHSGSLSPLLANCISAYAAR